MQAAMTAAPQRTLQRRRPQRSRSRKSMDRFAIATTPISLTLGFVAVRVKDTPSLHEYSCSLPCPRFSPQHDHAKAVCGWHECIHLLPSHACVLLPSFAERFLVLIGSMSLEGTGLRTDSRPRKSRCGDTDDGFHAKPWRLHMVWLPSSPPATKRHLLVLGLLKPGIWALI